MKVAVAGAYIRCNDCGVPAGNPDGTLAELRGRIALLDWRFEAPDQDFCPVCTTRRDQKTARMLAICDRLIAAETEYAAWKVVP